MIDKHLQPAHARTTASPVARQRGQATVEFAVLALVLVPLLIGAVLVGKYLDLMNATESASRYVAFEGMARNSSSSWKTDAELAAEVRRRFFSNADAPVKTNDTAGDFAAHRNPLWTDHTGRAFISDFAQDVSVQTRIEGRNAIAAARPYANSFDLPDQNWYTAAVTVRPANVPEFRPFDALNLNITRRTVLLSDPWTARDAADIRGRIEGSILAYPIGRIEPLVNLIGQIPPLILDPALRLSAFEWDVVPCDRLVGGCP
jgi:Flp pilus assembly protein TadG